MKIILSLTDKIKKQVQALDQQQVLNDDLTARLENTESVRDFLIDKLKSAELAIKSMISEISTLKKQNTNDNEVNKYDLIYKFIYLIYNLFIFLDYIIS